HRRHGAAVGESHGDGFGGRLTRADDEGRAVIRTVWTEHCERIAFDRLRKSVSQRLKPPELLGDRRCLDVIELGKFLVEVRVALRRDLALIRFLRVLGVDTLGYVHALGDFSERRKTLSVEEIVVLVVDEELRAARIRRARPRKGDIALFISLL